MTGTTTGMTTGTTTGTKSRGWAVAAGLLLTAGTLPLGVQLATRGDGPDVAAPRIEHAAPRDQAAVAPSRPAPVEAIGRDPGIAARQAEAARTAVQPARERALLAEAPRPLLAEAPRPLPAPPPAPLAASPPPLAKVQTRSAQLAIPSPAEPQPTAEPQGRDAFAGNPENPFRVTRETPVSTFSLDVDTASYAFARASLARNVLPPKASVRTEEFVNTFPYDYPAPRSAAEPFKVTVSTFPSPWNPGRRMVHVGIRAYALAPAERPPANLVFLVDTSGSMAAPNRLPLAKQALSLLVGQLDGRDKVAIVAYAGAAGTVLEPTPASEKGRILAAIERLGAGGGTAGAEGIRQAYALAEANYDPKAVNRVMLATDGDFNLGITDRGELQGFVERKRETGIFLSVLGFGMGNYNDATMQALAQNGNGVAAYIDTLAEARKTLVEEATATLVTVARDAKVQVEFDPAKVAEYRLVGYESRGLRREDFNNDKVDAGDVGSGHTVTAIYEVVPVGAERVNPDLRYGPKSPAESPAESPAKPTAKPTATSPGEARGDAASGPAGAEGELGFLALRYKLPGEERSRLISAPVPAEGATSFEAAPPEARFAVSVAGFAELLRGGRQTGRLTYDDVIRTASAARGEDAFGYRSDFVQLVRAAKAAAALAPLERR